MTCEHDANHLLKITAMYNYKILCTQCGQSYRTWNNYCNDSEPKLLEIWNHKKLNEVKFNNKIDSIRFQKSKFFQELLKTYKTPLDRNKYFLILKSKQKHTKSRKYSNKSRKNTRKKKL